MAEAQLAGKTKAQVEAMAPKVALQVLDVSFNALPDPKERSYLMNLPTSFVLPPEDVDRLRAAAGQILRHSPGYEALVREINAKSEG